MNEIQTLLTAGNAAISLEYGLSHVEDMTSDWVCGAI